MKTGISELILVVEDDRDLSETLEFNLTRGGFRTVVATSGPEALELAARQPLPDLILLDVMLPGLSGMEVCGRLREREETRRVPVIMLTARGEEVDRVAGFEVGADDYVTKPFSVRELMLRIRAVLRREREPDADRGAISFGLLRLDEASHRAWVGGEERELTALEFRLLVRMISRRGRAQSRQQLLEHVWGVQAEVTTRTVDTHVKRLRRKLGPAGRYIETLRGVGYRFRARPDEA